MQKINLTAPQHRAYNALSDGKWKSSYEIGEGMNTLYALKRKGYVISSGENQPGAFSMPQSTIKFKRVDIA